MKSFRYIPLVVAAVILSGCGPRIIGWRQVASTAPPLRVAGYECQRDVLTVHPAYLSQNVFVAADQQTNMMAACMNAKGYMPILDK